MSRTAPVESASSPSDGTKVHANASKRPTCDYERIARDIRADAGASTPRTTTGFSDRRGDEPPEAARHPAVAG
jgi:hypothetical protein